MNDQQRKLAAGGAFALVAALILYFELRDPAPPLAAPQAAVATAPATSARAGSASGGPVASEAGAVGAKHPSTQQLDPTLHMGAMLVTEGLQYSGSGRNIFSGMSTASLPVIPKPVTGPRPKPTTTTPQTFTTTVPIGPPPIDLKFFGTETRGGQRQAFLLRGDDVVVASAGEIVQRRYKVLSIAASSVVVEDLQNNNRQTLPLSN